MITVLSKSGTSEIKTTPGITRGFPTYKTQPCESNETGAEYLNISDVVCVMNNLISGINST